MVEVVGFVLIGVGLIIVEELWEPELWFVAFVGLMFCCGGINGLTTGVFDTGDVLG